MESSKGVFTRLVFVLGLLNAIITVSSTAGLTNQWIQTEIVQASSPAAQSYFGAEVSMSPFENLALVGANGANSNTGAAYIFQNPNEVGTGWSQVATLLPSGDTTAATFGVSSAFGNGFVAVGANGQYNQEGRVYLFSADSSRTVWTQTQVLQASDATASANFGFSVAMNGQNLFVGAPFAGQYGEGQVYVFQKQGNTWNQTQLIVLGSNLSTSAFGYSLAASASWLVVGAKGDGTLRTGNVYVYKNNSATNWELNTLLSPTDTSEQALYGVSVGISGSYIVVGASNSNNGVGQSYVYYFNPAILKWAYDSTLFPPDANTLNDFGVSNAIVSNSESSLIIVGAPGYQGGRAYVFGLQDSGWTLQSELMGNTSSNQQFGASVSICNLTALSGASDTNNAVGSAYFYQGHPTTYSPTPAPVPGAPSFAPTFAPVNSGPFMQSLVVDVDSPQDFSFLGASIGVAKVNGAPYILSGATGYNSNTGAVFVFSPASGAWTQVQMLQGSNSIGATFGCAISCFATTCAVGANGLNTQTGAVYVYTTTTGTSWSLSATLNPSNPDFGMQFGTSVAAVFGQIFVGAPFASALAYGAVYVYTYSSTSSSWKQTQILTASNQLPDAHFGISLSASNFLLAVGAASQANVGVTSGSVFVFQGLTSTGNYTWVQKAQLTPPDGVQNGLFGASVAGYGNTIVVGTPNGMGSVNGVNQQTGRAYIYQTTVAGFNYKNWTMKAELSASDAASGAQFGSSVALVTTQTGLIVAALVGAPEAAGATGRVYAYQSSGISWSQFAELFSSGSTSGSDFGGSLAVWLNQVYVGAQNFNSGQGLIFTFVDTALTYSPTMAPTGGVSPAGSGSGLSPGGVAGAVIGTLVAVGVIGAIAYLYVTKTAADRALNAPLVDPVTMSPVQPARSVPTPTSSFGQEL